MATKILEGFFFFVTGKLIEGNSISARSADQKTVRYLTKI